ncbi:12756_t:CDS:2 [Funneliformis caledonium]|uniref:12756_t:CDS:1 n=1 Tax=Funneliformis caledonium TaxID=1117310 RepID=A0A9N9HVS1_9GLOM|nr:12756_t:CDS:2 [Funneliformis caledonium]
MPRPKKSRINKDRSNITETGPKTRDLVKCNCMLCCHDSKWVDPRIFERHQNEYNKYQTMASESYKSSQSKNPKEKEKEIIPAKENQTLTYSSSNNDNDYTLIDIPKRKK